jgi:hypothetical protein
MIGNDAQINVAGTEVAVKTDSGVATSNIQSTIDSYGNVTSGALFVMFDNTVNHGVVYYDPNPSVAGGAVQVAELDNITSLTQLQNFNVSDFHLI